MTYELYFHEQAHAEWRKLDNSIKQQFKKQLARRLENPRLPSVALSGMADCYKIKLRSTGYRLVYRVDDNKVVVTVIAIGKRERNTVYLAAASRI